MADLTYRDLLEPDEWHLAEPEECLDATDPSTDPFFRKLERLEAVAAVARRKLRPRHVRVAQDVMLGHPHKEIAKRHRYAPGTIAQIANRDDVQDYMRALSHVRQVRDGPGIEQRRDMLYRIARRSETTGPLTAIAAIREINRMQGDYLPPPEAPQAKIEIVINAEAFPQTSLDALPPEMAALPAPAGATIEHNPHETPRED